MKWLLILCVCCYTRIYGQDPNRYELVIHEIFADPSPTVSLPSSEYIEIRNRGNHEINLKNWALTNGNTTGRINASISIKPDSILLLCSSSSLVQFLPYGRAAALSPWPAIDNDGDTLVLLSPSGSVIHAVAWDKQWYGNAWKEEGGWSIEMKDVRFPCLGRENWMASMNPAGGTPAAANSLTAMNKDTVPPKLLYGFMRGSHSLALVFSEPLDPDSIPVTLQFVPGATVITSSLSPPLFNTLVLELMDTIREEQLYTLHYEGISDCEKNMCRGPDIKFGKFSAVIPQDIIINEILFNPVPGGSDYVELYNRSEKIIDVSGLWLANRNATGRITSARQLSNTPYPLLPGEYLAITENLPWLLKQYGVSAIKALETPSLPSYPDDRGTVVLLNNNGAVTDEVSYDEKWQFALIDHREGVSLERIRAGSPAQDALNWHSASTASGYGTPGYLNSQSMSAIVQGGPVTTSSPLISPDMDGRDDLLFINYQFPEPGYVANVIVFDANGRTVRWLARNALCGINGYFRWDGTGEMGEKLPMGNYIILTDVFQIRGKTQRYRNVVGLVR